MGWIRSPGAGLGNLLFPISRALIGQQRHGGLLVYPTLRQVKIGTYVRRERDKRTYGNVLRSRSRDEWGSWLSAKTQRRISETEFDGSQQNVTVSYAGLRNYFHDLQGHHGLISQWLLGNMRGRLEQDVFDIGIHVRFGDFSTQSPAAAGHSIRLPLDWYRMAYAEAKRTVGLERPRTLLFTDEPPHEIRSALGLTAIELDTSPNALIAMMKLSRARCVVASRSTFSMWAAFLGDSDAIWDASYGDLEVRSDTERPATYTLGSNRITYRYRHRGSEP